MIRVVAACAIVALSACNASPVSDAISREPGAPRTAQPSPELLERVYLLARDGAYAEQIARHCPRYRMDAGRKRAVEERIRAMGREEGVSSRTLFYRFRNFGIDQSARVQSDLFDWIERRGVIVGQAPTFCAAGDAERAEGTGIGAYLIPRR